MMDDKKLKELEEYINKLTSTDINGMIDGLGDSVTKIRIDSFKVNDELTIFKNGLLQYMAYNKEEKHIELCFPGQLVKLSATQFEYIKLLKEYLKE